MANLKFCGPKCSIAVFLLSTWGIVQLGLMSVFFYTKSVALIEDLPLEDSYNSYSEYAQVSLQKHYYLTSIYFSNGSMIRAI